MDTNRTRLFFWAAIALVLAFLWTKWNALFAPPVPSAPAAAVQTVKSASLSDTVPVASPDGRPATSPVISALREGSPHLVIATTDLLRLSINPENGAIIEANLLQYPKTLGSKTPVQLLYRDESGQYIAQSGLIEADAHDHPLHFSSAKTNYVLTPGQQNLEIKLIGTEEGLKVTKTYTLHRNSYQIDVNYSIQNTAHQTWVGQLFGQIVRTPPTNDSKGLYTKVATFTGAAYSTPDAHYNTLSFKDMMNSNLQVSTQGGWAAMVDHYFISAWIPNAQDPSTYYSRVYDNHNFAVGSLSPTFSLAEGQQANWGGKFYVGPTLTDQLNQAAPYLSLTIDYGWLWFIAKYLFLLLQGIEALIKNWGWSIVILTLLIKLAFFPLSAKSYRSMAKMRVIAPKVKALQERFKDDRAQLSKAMMELYRKEEVNPLGGCLPVLLQIPVFIALYWMLMASVELRQAPFMFWIHDLSTRDPYFVLPVLTGVLILVQQLLSPKPPDKTQAYVMMLMPVLFCVFLLNLPAGLTLYMVVNVALSILQQALIMRTVRQETAGSKQ